MPKNPGPRPQKPLTVLLADDSQAIRQGLQRLFSTLPGFKVVAEAQDGWQALEAITKLHPDLAVLDIRMPGMTGLELLQKLKENTCSCKVLVFSQYGEQAYRRKCRELGAYGFFDKVSGIDEFQKALRQIETRYSSSALTGKDLPHGNKS